MTDATKLAACPNPWCTAPSKLQGKAWPVFLKRQGWRVWCPCGVATPYYPTESEAIAAWQARSRPVTSAGVEEIARFVEQWNGSTRDGDTFLIADAIREAFSLSTTAEQRADTAALAGEVEQLREAATFLMHAARPEDCMKAMKALAWHLDEHWGTILTALRASPDGQTIALFREARAKLEQLDCSIAFLARIDAHLSSNPVAEDAERGEG